MRFKETSFELVLSNNLKAILLFVSSFLLLAFVCNQISEVLVYAIGLSEKGRRTWLATMVAVGLYGLYRLIKWVSAEPMRITVYADKLSILNRKTEAKREVPFDDIVAYRFIDFNNETTLRLRMTDGSKMKFQINDVLHGGQNLAELVQAFEAALSQYAATHSETNASGIAIRERTFFEKPISTFLLVLFAGLIGCMTWDRYVHHRASSSSMFSLWGIFSAYLVAWLVGRERRKQKA